MNKTHFTFKLRLSRKNVHDMRTIYFYANVNGVVKYYSTNHSVPELAWNQQKKKKEVK